MFVHSGPESSKPAGDGESGCWNVGDVEVDWTRCVLQRDNFGGVQALSAFLLAGPGVHLKHDEDQSEVLEPVGS